MGSALEELKSFHDRAKRPARMEARPFDSSAAIKISTENQFHESTYPSMPPGPALQCRR